jgi:hypothetical protein
VRRREVSSWTWREFSSRRCVEVMRVVKRRRRARPIIDASPWRRGRRTSSPRRGLLLLVLVLVLVLALMTVLGRTVVGVIFGRGNVSVDGARDGGHGIWARWCDGGLGSGRTAVVERRSGWRGVSIERRSAVMISRVGKGSARSAMHGVVVLVSKSSVADVLGV